MIYIKYTNEKIYVEDEEICLARLCNRSAEFWYCGEYVSNCTFTTFKEKIKKDFDVEIDINQSPEWCKFWYEKC